MNRNRMVTQKIGRDQVTRLSEIRPCSPRATSISRSVSRAALLAASVCPSWTASDASCRANVASRPSLNPDQSIFLVASASTASSSSSSSSGSVSVWLGVGRQSSICPLTRSRRMATLRSSWSSWVVRSAWISRLDWSASLSVTPAASRGSQWSLKSSNRPSNRSRIARSTSSTYVKPRRCWNLEMRPVSSKAVVVVALRCSTSVLASSARSGAGSPSMRRCADSTCRCSRRRADALASYSVAIWRWVSALRKSCEGVRSSTSSVADCAWASVLVSSTATNTSHRSGWNK